MQTKTVAGRLDMKKLASQNSIWLVFIVIAGIMSVASPTFLTPLNITNLLTTESIKGIMTVGVMFCILSRGIDLSTASVLALSSVVSASLVQEVADGKLFPNLPTMPAVVGVLAGLAVGIIFGMVNGLLIAYTKIPAFIATLGTQLAVKAIAQLYTNAYPVAQLSKGFKSIGQGALIPGVPNVVLIFVIILVIGGFLLTQTRYGKNIYAIGGNDIAARVAGINVEKNIVKVYTFCSVCAALGGVLLASRSGAGNSTLGFNYELDAIAAATVGGTSHSGGIARISGVIAGILLLGVINNGLLLLGVSPYIQQIVKGVIIVGAVVFDMRKHAKKA